MVEQAPLQLYCSSLIFAPGKSIVRRQFEECIPAWIQTQPKAQADWSTVLQTLEGHSSRVKSVAFSPDGKLVVSGSRDRTGRVWDAATGALLQTLEGHSSRVNSVAFSPNGQAENTLLVSKGWIADGGANILWLPVDYRSPTCIAVWNRTLALGYSSGRVFILGFKEGLKLI
jgi:WD40 repeat protein